MKSLKNRIDNVKELSNITENKWIELLSVLIRMLKILSKMESKKIANLKLRIKFCVRKLGICKIYLIRISPLTKKHRERLIP